MAGSGHAIISGKFFSNDSGNWSSDPYIIREYAQNYLDYVEIYLAETARWALPNDSIPDPET